MRYPRRRQRRCGLCDVLIQEFRVVPIKEPDERIAEIATSANCTLKYILAFGKNPLAAFEPRGRQTALAGNEGLTPDSQAVVLAT